MTEEVQHDVPEQVLEIQRIYTKDVSVETPGAPAVFQKDWQPAITVDLCVKQAELETDLYEVILSVTVSAKMEEQTVFLVEIHQAGIFYAKGFEKEQLDPILYVYCPNLLFPYARERISDAIMHASFPQLNLNPVNFEMMYEEQKRAEAASEKE